MSLPSKKNAPTKEPKPSKITSFLSAISEFSPRETILEIAEHTAQSIKIAEIAINELNGDET